MKHKFICSAILLGLAVVSLSSCSKGTIDRYKRQIKDYSNEVSEADMVITNDELKAASDRIKAKDYEISLEAFERMMYQEYFKANKTDTTLNANNEVNRNNSISFDSESGNYHILSSEAMTSEAIDVRNKLQSNNESSMDQSYERAGDGAVLFDNKNMTYQKIPKLLWTSLEDKMSPYMILHTLGAMKYFNEAPMKYYADDNRFTITVDNENQGISQNGIIQFEIEEYSIECVYYFSYKEIWDGNQYRERHIELGGNVDIKCDDKELKDKPIDKYLNLDNKLI